MRYALSKLEIVNGLQMENCCVCGTPFGIETGLLKNLRDSHRTFYCPNGHTNFYPAKSEAEKLRVEVAALERAVISERQLRIAAENATHKLKRRVSKGVCPCCKRSFENLRRHIETKHLDMAKKEPTQI